MRGLMIDCSRLVERHGYYHELIARCSAWGYDALVLHCCDDHGLTAVLPGMEDLAAPHALPTAELRALIAAGRAADMRIIPEIECFGHARWLEGHPRWDACFAGDRGRESLAFNAVDPVSPLTAELMQRLIAAVCAVFDDEVVHIGCDEVDLGDFCARRGLGDPHDVWSGWVNRLIAMVRAQGRRAMLWADHLEKEERIARAVDTDAIVVSWHYGPDDDADGAGMRRLRDAGFRDIIAAPAVQCWSSRIHCLQRNLENVAAMEGHARACGAAGTLDTIWCPFRHIQGALWHGLASAAIIHRTGVLPDDDGSAVADLLFGGGNAATRRLCRDLPLLECHNQLFWHLWHGTRPGSLTLTEAGCNLRLGAELLPAIAGAEVPRHGADLQAMQLAARTAVHLSQRLLRPDLAGDAAHRREHAALTAELAADWDATRFPDDPARATPRWSASWGHHHLLALMARLGGACG
ncbi:MAG: family 20 glycosylhydrolase [Planctomycetes bacterium]|nr:family 20 glycosylhydrolase [Planctomycetota bacterium]